MSKEFNVGDQVVLTKTDPRTSNTHVLVGTVQAKSGKDGEELTVKIPAVVSGAAARVVTVPAESVRHVKEVYGVSQVPLAAGARRIIRQI